MITAISRVIAGLLTILWLGSALAAGSAISNLDSDAFMKMLMTQLKYQDPSAPMDNAQMVSQLSDMTMMEQNAQLVKAMNSLKDQAYQSQGLYASNLVGKEVMVMAGLFKVRQRQLPSGEVLLNHAADSLVIRVYGREADPKTAKPLGTLELGRQTQSGKVPYDLADLDKPLADGTYIMYAYAQANGQESEQVITQHSKVNSVVIPGNGKDVLVDAEGIGLVPLSSLTEFKGDYVPPESAKSQSSDPFSSALKKEMTPVERQGQRWTRNPLFKKSSPQANRQNLPKSPREALFRNGP